VAERVLVIDDEERIRKLLIMYLEKEGSHEFKLSLKTSLNAPSNPQSKNIHIQVTGEDFYVLTKDIVEKSNDMKTLFGVTYFSK